MAKTWDTSSYEETVKSFTSYTSNGEMMNEWKKQMGRDGHWDIVDTVMHKYLRRIGIQEEHLNKLSIIHIAGSKGKGSTCAFTESILCHHGYRTGMFVSPHLVDLRERICINGRPLRKEQFCHYYWDTVRKLENTKTDGPLEEGGHMPSFFDLTLVMAINTFIREKTDVIILEVGRGGRMDWTNFVRNPVVCGITPLALEHTKDLGDTIDKIAWHKAGIIKQGRPVFTTPQEEKALRVVLDEAKEKRAPMFMALPLTESLLQQYSCRLGVLGQVQQQNAAMAIQLFRCWQRWKDGDDVTGQALNQLNATLVSNIEEIPRLSCTHLEDKVIQGLSNCRLNGRTQTVSRDRVTFYLDFAHTEDSMKNCTRWFDRVASKEAASLSCKTARVLLFYCLPDKDSQKLFPPLMKLNFDAVAFTSYKVQDSEPLGQRGDRRHYNYIPFDLQQHILRLHDIWNNDSGEDRNGRIPAQNVRPENSTATTKNSTLLETSTGFKSTNGNLQISKNFHEFGEVRVSPTENGASESATGKMSLNFDISGKSSNGDTFPQAIQSTRSFDCALQALMWVTQGKDADIASAVSAQLESLPPAPMTVKDADHVQVLVTGSCKIVGLLLSILLPDVYD